MGCFKCNRTCATHEKVDVCRFLPLLAAIGVMGMVNSHTTTVDVKIRSSTALAAAARQLGGTVIGAGEHGLYYGNKEQGFAVKLPGWVYPVVLTNKGELRFDLYGNTADAPTIAQLTGAYVLSAAREAAGTLGWRVVESSPESVTIRHSSGGTLKVDAYGRCEASGFTGTGCHATRPIEQAIGEIKDRKFKPEYYNLQRAGIKQVG